MIHITLGELTSAKDALQRVLQLPLTPKHAYHVARLARLVQPELAQFDQSREALIKQFGAERPSTDAEKSSGQGETVFAVTPENLQEFCTKLIELAAVVAPIDWTPITLDMLGTCDISGADLLSLGPLFSET